MIANGISDFFSTRWSVATPMANSEEPATKLAVAEKHIE